MDYKLSLRYLATAFKVLALITILLTIFITILTVTLQTGEQMGQQPPGFLIFNAAFPVLLGVVKSLFLYFLGEFIILMLAIKKDLATIKKNLAKQN